MVAIWFDPSTAATDRLTASVTVGSAAETTRTLDVGVRSIGRRGVVLKTAGDLGGARHAWMDLALPGGRSIRPLVEIGRSDQGHTPVRFKHLFPRDREALEAFHLSRATTSGY
ncbi:MAG: hypothetical protein ACQEXJ_16530 [Myxococcota bacterium]